MWNGNHLYIKMPNICRLYVVFPDTLRARPRKAKRVLVSCIFQITLNAHEITISYAFMCARLLQSCLTFCDPMECSPPGSSVHGKPSRQEYRSGPPCPPPEDLLNPGVELHFLASCVGWGCFTTGATEETTIISYIVAQNAGLLFHR